MSKKRKNRQRDMPSEKRSPSVQSIMLTDPAARDIIFPEGYTPLSRNEDVQQCVSQIANRVSNMTVMLMQNGENGDIRIRNELSRKLDITPCHYMNRKNFLYRIVTDMCNSGNCVAVPKYKGEYLDGIEILERGSCTFMQDVRYGYLIRYYGEVLYPDEVLHFVLNPNPREPWRGDGLAPMIYGTVRNLVQARATKDAFLKSKWKPSLIISVRSDIEELQDSSTREDILDSYISSNEQGKPWLIPADEINVNSIKPLTLNDLAIQDGITLDKRTLAAAVGVPPFLVGVGNYIKDEYNGFISTTVLDFAQIIQQELSRKLLLSDQWYIKLNSKSLMQYSLAEKSGFVNSMVERGMLNKNEGRTEFDYNPVDAPGMNDYTVLENFIPVDTLGKQKKLLQEVENALQT